jgi:hypothetical protein
MGNTEDAKGCRMHQAPLGGEFSIRRRWIVKDASLTRGRPVGYPAAGKCTAKAILFQLTRKGLGARIIMDEPAYMASGPGSGDTVEKGFSRSLAAHYLLLSRIRVARKINGKVWICGHMMALTHKWTNSKSVLYHPYRIFKHLLRKSWLHTDPERVTHDGVCIDEFTTNPEFSTLHIRLAHKVSGKKKPRPNFMRVELLE